MEFTHFDEQGNARMVDVTAKGETVREAVAKGRIRVSEECFGKIKEGTMAKGGLDCKRLSYYPEFVVLWLRWFSSIIVPWCVDMPAPFILKRGLSRK